MENYLSLEDEPDIPGEIDFLFLNRYGRHPRRVTFPEKLHRCKWKLMPRLRKTLAASIVFKEYANDLAVWKNCLWWLRKLTKEKQ